VCDGLTSLDYVKEEASAGRMGRQLLAVLVKRDGQRYFRGGHEEPTLLREAFDEGKGIIPDQQLPARALGFRVQPYGFTEWRQFYTQRQLSLLSTLVEVLPEVRSEALGTGADDGYADALVTYLAFFVDRVAARNSAFSFWHPGRGTVESATATNYVQMRWSFVEANPFADASGGLSGQLRFLVDAVASLPAGPRARAVQRDAISTPLEQGAAFCTDPPYFDSIPYADLSDFYYVWLKRSLGTVYPDLFSTILTPKASELVADGERHGGRQSATDFFRQGFRKAFDRMIAAGHPEVPIVVYYAQRQREEGEDGALTSTGWEAMLQSLVDARLMVTATWPVRTEQRGGLRAHGRNALASSVVIACRPVRADAPIATVRELVTALRDELPVALRKLQHESIAPVDLAQAAIGPGMAVFSRYARVIEADGSNVPVQRALHVINQVLDELLAEQDGDLDAYTRFAVAWYEQYGLGEGPFGDVETLCKAKNVALDGLLAAGIIHTRPDRIRLLAREELDGAWDPMKDQRLTVWEVTQHLARALDEKGEDGAALLLRRVGGLGDVARDLAYRLYDLSERRQLAGEARAYNALVVAWPEIASRAASQADAQQELEV
jgi:putative DNA methylase